MTQQESELFDIIEQQIQSRLWEIQKAMEESRWVVAIDAIRSTRKITSEQFYKLRGLHTED